MSGSGGNDGRWGGGKVEGQGGTGDTRRSEKVSGDLVGCDRESGADHGR